MRERGLGDGERQTERRLRRVSDVCYALLFARESSTRACIREHVRSDEIVGARGNRGRSRIESQW